MEWCSFQLVIVLGINSICTTVSCFGYIFALNEVSRGQLRDDIFHCGVVVDGPLSSNNRLHHILCRSKSENMKKLLHMLTFYCTCTFLKCAIIVAI
jgi:hypothetical protein